MQASAGLHQIWARLLLPSKTAHLALLAACNPPACAASFAPSASILAVQPCAGRLQFDSLAVNSMSLGCYSCQRLALLQYSAESRHHFSNIPNGLACCAVSAALPAFRDNGISLLHNTYWMSFCCRTRSQKVAGSQCGQQVSVPRQVRLAMSQLVPRLLSWHRGTIPRAASAAALSARLWLPQVCHVAITQCSTHGPVAPFT